MIDFLGQDLKRFKMTCFALAHDMISASILDNHNLGLINNLVYKIFHRLLYCFTFEVSLQIFILITHVQLCLLDYFYTIDRHIIKRIILIQIKFNVNIKTFRHSLKIVDSTSFELLFHTCKASSSTDLGHYIAMHASTKFVPD